MRKACGSSSASRVSFTTIAQKSTTVASGAVIGSPSPMYRLGIRKITLSARVRIISASRISTYESHHTSPPNRSVRPWRKRST